MRKTVFQYFTALNPLKILRTYRYTVQKPNFHNYLYGFLSNSCLCTKYFAQKTLSSLVHLIFSFRLSFRWVEIKGLLLKLTHLHATISNISSEWQCTKHSNPSSCYFISIYFEEQLVWWCSYFCYSFTKQYWAIKCHMLLPNVFTHLNSNIENRFILDILYTRTVHRADDLYIIHRFVVSKIISIPNQLQWSLRQSMELKTFCITVFGVVYKYMISDEILWYFLNIQNRHSHDMSAERSLYPIAFFWILMYFIEFYWTLNT